MITIPILTGATPRAMTGQNNKALRKYSFFMLTPIFSPPTPKGESF